MEKIVQPILFGADLNSYSVARAFYEEYKIKSYVVGKKISAPFFNSKILHFIEEENIIDKTVFHKTVNHIINITGGEDKKYILLGCGDDYLELLASEKNNLPKNCIAPYVSIETMRGLIRKTDFYKLCDINDLPHPKTLVHIASDSTENVVTPFTYPVIVKPSNTVSYWEVKFSGQKKVYVNIHSEDELCKILKLVRDGGYTDDIIIQEMIPGSDDAMRVLTTYSSQEGKVKVMALGHVLLEEHTPKGIGNHAAIINEYGENVKNNLLDKVEKFLNDINFKGFANFDIKYDSRDGGYKLFEINLRQGRSNYYMTNGGGNVAKILINDLIENKISDAVEYIKDQNLFTVIPLPLILFYTRKTKDFFTVLKLILNCKYTNPVFYKKDFNIKRFIFLTKTHLSHYYKYAKYYR